MAKKVIWSGQAKSDLLRIYQFNREILGERSAYALIVSLMGKVELLSNNIIGSTKFLSDLHPEINYQKLIFKNYLIIFRTENNNVFLNRIFDSRQNPQGIGI